MLRERVSLEDSEWIRLNLSRQFEKVCSWSFQVQAYSCHSRFCCDEISPEEKPYALPACAMYPLCWPKG